MSLHPLCLLQLDTISDCFNSVKISGLFLPVFSLEILFKNLKEEEHFQAICSILSFICSLLNKEQIDPSWAAQVKK